MKKFLQKTFLLLLTLIVGGATFSTARAQSDKSTDYTGNITLSSSGGTSAYACSISINSNSYNGIKAGTGKAAGAVKIAVPKDAKYLHMHIAAWNGETVKVQVKAGSTTVASNVSLTSDSGISGSSPFTLNSATKASTDYYKVFTFETPLASNTDITVTATTGNRFVVWGVTSEEEGSSKEEAGLAYAESSYSNILPGASFVTPELTNPNGLTVSYTSNDSEIAAVNSSTGVITIGTKEGTATITASSAETETYAAGSATYTITVAKGTTTVTLNNTALTFNIIDGTTQTLTGAPKYNDEAIDGAVVTWSIVSGGDYASVSDAGVVTALAPGSATIRASYSGSTIYAASYADCAVTVNKANTTLTLDKTSVSQDLKDGRTVILTPTVTATKTGGTESVASPIVTWSSSDATVATVSEGLITGLKAGDVTITASYAGGDNYNAADDATCSITFTDTRTAVNISAFTAAKTTLVIGDEQATAITNDQVGWTSAYTYSSSDEDVATVDENGVITAVAKGTATITATIKIALDETGYKAGTTDSKTLSITVTKPFHTVTFSINGDVSRTASVEEDETITFPTAVDTPADAAEFNKTLADGKTFVGWYTAEYSHATNAPASYVNTSTTTMSTKDVTYYAVYANIEITEGSYTLDYSNESSLSGSTSWGSYGKTYNYTASDGSTWTIKAYKSSGMQINTGKDCSIKVPSCPGNIQSIAITCSAAKAVGFSSSDYTGSGTITYLASGTDKVSQTLDLTSKSVTTGYIVPKSGSTSITKIVVSYRNVNASNFTTDNRDAAGIAYANASVDVKLTSGYTGQALTNPNSLSVTYSSSDESVATINSSTGAITELLKAGSTTITATFTGNEAYKPAEASYDLNVTEKTPCGLAYATGEVAKLTTDAAFTNTLTNGYSLTVSYESSDEEVATVNSSTGEVTVVGAGETTIKATFAGNEDYEAGNASYTLTVSRNTPSLSVENIEMDITTEIMLASIYTTNSDGEVTINSSATSIAQITDGKLKAVGIGDAIITVSIAQSSTYAAIEKTFTVTVSSKPGVAPLAYDAGGYKLVTDASTLQAGDILLFVGTNPDTKKNFAMAGQNENNRTEAEVSISDNTISEKPAAAQEVTLEGETDAWYFNVGADAYLYAASSSSNYLKTNTKEEVSDNGKAEIGINTVNGNTTITFQGSNTKNKLQYNSSNGIFSCYSTTQKPVRFYRYNASKPYNVTIGTTGYKTIVLANDATMPSGLEAYIVTAAGEKAILTKVDKVKKNTPVILKGVPDTYTLTAIDASEYSYPSTNLLAISTNTTGNGSDGGVYVLANKTNGVGFYLWNGGSLGAGRVYLPGNKLEEAEIREFVGFLMDNETRLEDLNVNDDLNKAVYDLSGRRVVKPTKGLYIVNGKKYIKK